MNGLAQSADSGTFSPLQPARDSQSRATQLEISNYFDKKVIWIRLLAILLLAFFSPLIGMIILLVRMTSPGPGLFRQTRLGKDSKRFELLKIRTMYCDAEVLSGPMLCQPKDSRITPIGRLLRFLHLDELPQLINVVRGEMCLIGPRPERPEIIAKNRLNDRVLGFSDRTRVLPGVTGLAQINLPADQTADCVIPKVKLDLEYIRTASASLDLRILLCTALRMIGVRHGRAVRLLGVGRKSVPEKVDSSASNRKSDSKSYALYALHPEDSRQPTFAYADTNGSNAPPSVTSSWREVDLKDTAKNGMKEKELSALPHRPR